jgi:hypothetical protein
MMPSREFPASKEYRYPQNKLKLLQAYFPLRGAKKFLCLYSRFYFFSIALAIPAVP